MKYADIIVDITLEKLNHTFQYLIPEELQSEVTVGIRVIVPFGSGKREINGVVVEISDEPKLDPGRIKPIKGILYSQEKSEREMVALAYFLSEHFGSTMNQALKTVLPIRKKTPPKEVKMVSLKASRDETMNYLAALRAKKKYSVSKERLITELMEEQEIPWDIITGKLHITSDNIRALEKSGIVKVVSYREFRNPISKKTLEDSEHKKAVELNDEQKNCVETVRQDIRNNIIRPYLLYGVTGSGKTEVYMELIDDAISSGKEAIVLIPEIALTYQTVMRFYHRFGDMVSIINSRMTEGQRQDQLDRVKNGSCKIMVGPRSALFTPFSNLGIIIVDEEHETSYKSETAPRYHAVPVAVERGRLCSCPIVLGSATPSVETFQKAKSGQYGLLTLKNRVEDRNLPAAEIIDLRDELKAGNRSVLSRKLRELMADRLEKGEQTMLFLNRRGLMGSVSCRSCGTVIKCPHCDVSMTLHRDGQLHCHYCGYKMAKPVECPECHSKYIGTMRAGTEQVEESVQKLFPNARVLRMDADTTKGKDGHEKILAAFSNREADILIGTQMIVKGHDFPDVTLMGILAADMSLNVSDFRAAERTFDLLVQAAGRAGRGETPGTVLIQTYQTDNYSILASADQDYETFYRNEVMFRRLGGYPPFGHMLKIMLEEKNIKDLDKACEYLAGYLRKELPQTGDQDSAVLGPEDDFRHGSMIYTKRQYI
jgi:primosomal protein N' (replication factor Y)